MIDPETHETRTLPNPRHPKTKGRGKRTGFRDTYRFETLMEDAAAMIKLHLPQVEDWQADELAYDLVIGVIESKFLVQR